MKKRLIMVLAAMLILGGLFTGAAADEDKDLFTYSPFIEVKGKLKPVNLSSEGQGIRITVDSALVMDDRLWISYDLQDLEGSRIDEDVFADCSFQFFDYHMEKDKTSCSRGGFGETTDHGRMIQYVQSQQLKDMDTLSVNLHHFPAVKKYRIPLLPLLEKYEKEEAASIETSSLVPYGYRSLMPSKRVLDPTQSLDIPLSDDPETKGLLLSGIGWIDNVLHVQIHFTENEALKTENLMDLDRWNAAIRYFYGDLGDLNKISAVNHYLMWDDDGDGAMDWADLMMDCKRANMKEPEKYYIELTCIQDMLEGNWEFSIPLDQILEKSEGKNKGTIYEYGFVEPLVEINHSCEDQGIRISAVAARLTDDEFMIIYDLQDLEEHRIDWNICHVMSDLTHYNLNINMETNTQLGGSEFNDSKDHGKVMRGFHYTKLDSNDTLTMSMNNFPVYDHKSVAVLPLLEKYDKEATWCYLNTFSSLSTNIDMMPSNYMVLDYTNPLDIPLCEDPDMKDILLGGIGWLDDQLHILIHYVDHDQKGAKLGESATAVWDCNLRDQAVNAVYSRVGNHIIWDTNGDKVRDYAEFVIDCKPDDPKLGDYYLNLSYVREIINGNWEINIPLDEIR